MSTAGRAFHDGFRADCCKPAIRREPIEKEWKNIAKGESVDIT